MSAKDTGGAAFPCKVAVDGGINGYVNVDAPGMTLRDWFAGKELASLENKTICDRPDAYARVADHCYRMADAMLAARNT